jgi:maltose 6'-phosphate phosphatase
MRFRKSRPGEVSVLTLNLHCFQEDQPFAKLGVVAEAILELEPDVVALQECAQDRWAPERLRVNPGVVIREGNAALWLTERLRAGGQASHGAWDWAHYGWDRWEEGCAILSRHPIVYADSRYVTKGAHSVAWKSRKPVAARLLVPSFGPLSVFSTHLGWWGDEEEPFEDSLDQLTSWQAQFARPAEPMITAGDFNIIAGSKGYEFLTDWTLWSDCWLEAHPQDMNTPTTGPAAEGWEDSPEAKRIDYVFTRKEDALKVISCERIFTETTFGRVSDHVGLWAVLGR